MFCPLAVNSSCVAASRTWPMLPGRRLELQREHRLHRIDDHERRLDARDLLENPLEARLGEQVERRVADAEPLAARLDLVLGLLAGAVEHRADRARHVRRGLQQQRRLADARLAAEQHQRAGHDAAAEHAIELVDAGRQARVLFESRCRHRAAPRRSCRPSRSGAARGAAARRARPARSSTSEFQAPQSAQRPSHFGDCAPHSWQTKTVFGDLLIWSARLSRHCA